MFLPKDKKIFKEVFLLALPIILSNLSRVLMSIVDIAMVGRLGKEAIAATGMGGMLAWGALSVVLGVRTAVQTITSRRVGQNKQNDDASSRRNPAPRMRRRARRRRSRRARRTIFSLCVKMSIRAAFNADVSV